MVQRVIISDTCCLVDIRKANLLLALLKLPYEIVIPDILFEEELVRFTLTEKQLLEKYVRLGELSGQQVLDAQQLAKNYPALSLNDCFAFILAKYTPNCILLTGDKALRQVASSQSIDVHGVLWAIDEMHTASTATVACLYQALLLFMKDSTVRLPKSDLQQWHKKYTELL